MQEIDYTTLPTSLVDFGTALRMLADSQSDVTEIITKWETLFDMETPRTVEVTLSDGTVHNIDNLAKMREDLIAGLSLDEPKVKQLKMSSPYVKGGIRGNAWYGLHYGGESKNDETGMYLDNPDAGGFMGMRYGVQNVLRTCAFVDKATGTISMEEMPEMIIVGGFHKQGQVIPLTYELTLVAPGLDNVARGEMVTDVQYCGRVMFVNQNQESDFKLAVKDSVGSVLYTRDIPANKCIECAYWAAVGQGSVMFREIYWAPQPGVADNG